MAAMTVAIYLLVAFPCTAGRRTDVGGEASILLAAQQGVPSRLAGILADGTLVASKILGASYTPKSRLAKGLKLVAVGEAVTIVNASAATPPRRATLLHRVGRQDGRGETVAQVWDVAGDPYIYVVLQRASGSWSYMESTMVELDWPELGASQPRALIKSYERRKGNKLWDHYGMGEILRSVTAKFPEKALLITGQSRGATMAEVIGLRYALAFRNDTNYKAPLVVSTGAYRWTNAAGLLLVENLLGDNFAHVLLSRVQDGLREYDCVSRVPSRESGFVDMHPAFHIDIETGAVSECVQRSGCPGPDVTYAEMLNLYWSYMKLHKSIAYIHALKTSLLRAESQQQ